MTRSNSRRSLAIVGPALFGALAILQLGCGRKDDTEAGAPSSTTATPAADAEMQRGLDYLYKSNDPFSAAESFRTVLKSNPTHYGARFQLAKALDLSGKPDEARAVWQQVLAAADSIKDSVTVTTARARLASPDTVSQAAMMAVGLNKLYKNNDPAGAADEFKKVLQKNPTHYGATYQLAKALDQAGKSAEARPYWQKMVTMADAIKDQTTADTARARLQHK